MYVYSRLCALFEGEGVPLLLALRSLFEGEGVLLLAALRSLGGEGVPLLRVVFFQRSQRCDMKALHQSISDLQAALLPGSCSDD